jgi:DNA-binding PadR family transcriptional regulator
LQEPRLTPTSFIVLGLIELSGEATPYELKQAVNVSLGNFWSLQHAQLYSEPERLAKAGYLEERREQGGRRRRHYSITEKGRKALAEWRDSPADRILELRDLGLLKVFFGADPARVAEGQLEIYRRKLAEYEGLKSIDAGTEPRGPWLTLDAGIRHTNLSIEFWEEQRRRRRRRRG